MGTTEHRRSYLEKRRARAKAYLGGVCRCGSVSDLQFDHVDPSTKVLEIASCIASCWSWDRLVAELDKCQLLCRDCHRKKTRLNGENTGGGWNRIQVRRHGTAVRYNDGCRCEQCRTWKREYRNGRVSSLG